MSDQAAEDTDGAPFQIAVKPWQGGIPSTQVGVPALFHGASGTYRHLVPISSDSSYIIKPVCRFSITLYSCPLLTWQQVEITAGPMAGCRALILVPSSDTFRLLDLPAEIRNMVYANLCVYKSPIKLKTYMRGRLVQTTFRDYKESAVKKRNFDPTIRKYRNRNTTIASIHSVSRQVHSEAAEVLYSNNIFVMQDHATLNLLLRRAGSSAQFLRHIVLPRSFDYMRPREGPLMRLSIARNLRTLEFHRSDFTNIWGRDPLIQDCASLFKDLFKTRQGTQLAGKVMEVFQLSECDGVACRKARESSGVPPNICQTCGLDPTTSSAVFEAEQEAIKKEIEAKMEEDRKQTVDSLALSTEK